jgi:hypothetical protein
MAWQELPVGIQRLLLRGHYSCSENDFVHFRQEQLRRFVGEIVKTHEDGVTLLREGALKQLSHEDANMVDHALSCLFVVGERDDIPAIEGLLSHPDESVRKAARTCLFEIRHRV